MDFVDRFESLLAIGESCKSRIYFLKNQLESHLRGQRDERPECLINPDLSKIRQKISKGFPAVVDVSKIQGYDVLVAQAQDISVKLTSFRSLVDDIINFTESSKELLVAVTASILDFKMERNRSISLYFFDLLLSNIKVLWIFSTIDEKKVLFGLAEIVSEISASSGSDITVNPSKAIKIPTQRVMKIIADLDNIHLYFIHSFWPLAPMLRPMILQFKESIEYAENCTAMRDKSVFNSVNEASSNISKYAAGLLSPTSALNRYTELKDVDKYREYVILSCLVCPSILSDTEVTNLFKFVAKGQLFLCLYRDMTMNVHTEFEVLSLVFPIQDSNFLSQAATVASSTLSGSKAVSSNASSGIQSSPATFTYPSGFKLKKILKELSRLAVSTSALRFRERRSFILGEITSLNLILDTLPGLVGPKLPVILAAASFAKVEMLNYFRIGALLDIKAVRKDCRSYFDANDYEDEDAVLLLSELRKLINHVNTNRDVIYNYYAEYLIHIDMKALRSISAKCIGIIESSKVSLDAITADIDKLSRHFNALLTGNHSSPNAADTPPDLNCSLTSLRYHWNQLTCILYSQSVSIVTKNLGTFQELSLRMHGVYERSRNIDDIDNLIGEYMEPYDIWWFRDKVVECFQNSMNSTSRQSFRASALITFLPSVRYALCLSNQIETERIKLSIEFFMDDRMNELGTHVITLIKLFWGHLQALENQVTQIEAARRIEKLIQYKLNSKKSGDMTRNSDVGMRDSVGSDGEPPMGDKTAENTSNGAEALPGTESEAWAKESIEKLVDIRQRIINTMTMAYELQMMKIFSREYDITVFLRQMVVSFVEEHFVNLFTPASTGEQSNIILTTAGNQTSVYNLLGPKVILTRFKSLLHAANTALSCLDCHISTALRTILFKECCDLSMAPPGIPPAKLSANSLGEMIPKTEIEYWGNLLWSIVDWFSKLCHQVVSGDSLANNSDANNTLLWVPYLNSIVRPNVSVQGNIAPTRGTGRSNSVVASFFNNQVTNNLFNNAISLESIALESFLSRQELGSLCQIIGVQGVRVLDQDLLTTIIEKISIVKEFLFKYQQDLVEVYDDISKIFDTFRKLQDKISIVFIALKEIGLMLAVREILHLALRDSIEQFSPALVSLTKNAANMVLPWGNRKLVSPLYYLAFDCGNISANDVALAQALAPVLFMATDRPHLSLLPVLGSLYFLDESWKKAQYLSNMDCFLNNEHAVVYALSKLMICCFAKETMTELEASLIVSSSLRSTLPKAATSSRPQQMKEKSFASLNVSNISLSTVNDRKPNPNNGANIAEYDFKIHSEAFLIISVQLLFMMKDHIYYGKHFPINNMLITLEHFGQYLPQSDILDFSRLLPSNILHLTRVDAATTSADSQPKRVVARSNSIVSQQSSN